MPTDTSEKGLERLICTALTGHACDPPKSGQVSENPQPYGGLGWLGGNPKDYDRDYCLDLYQLKTFLQTTQNDLAETLDLNNDSPTRSKFLARLQGEISKRGTIDVLRKGIKHGTNDIELFYGTPSPHNAKAKERYQQNRFTVSRQIHYSRDQSQRSLDLVLFINGLPIITCELKNSLTQQTVQNAIQQYKTDRNPREKLFEFGRCVVHFAIDDQEIRFCTHLQGKASWFLPFNRGWNDGAGNPPNPNGLKTAYLWQEILKRDSLTNILENFAQIVSDPDPKTGKKKNKKQVWPRYHQLDVVRFLLKDVQHNGIGQRYLIQHSAGSGKSNSIAWLAHQLVTVSRFDQPVFDSVIVVTDRRILDRQICDNIKQFLQIESTVGHADYSGNLRQFLASGKKIIITTIQKFPFILDEIGNEQRGKNFAILIDEAHSSQGGQHSAAIGQALSGREPNPDDSPEDQINRLIEARKLLPNASYFAFTATPKNKTLELFGIPDPQPDGKVKHYPCHSYTMKQAIQEGFILDVLAHYTPVSSYYRLTKTIADDPAFDSKKALKKLRKYVEGHDHAIRLKTEIMVDHFQEQVIAQGKIGGQARAMVVTNGIKQAIHYFHAFQSYLQERKSPYQAIVAFSGEYDYDGVKVTEASLNGFPSNDIAHQIQTDPYRFLICADKFQTGYDEPLLHTLYVDKTLSGIKAVQTLSRLNRAHPQKHDVFVLDFVNDTDTIRDSFADFYRTTILADETDRNKLNDLQYDLDQAEVYTQEQVDDLVTRYLQGAERDRLDPILDTCVARYLDQLDEDEQITFKGNAKAFIRTYGFLSAVLPRQDNRLDWEKRSIFLNFLVPKLPAPTDTDLARGILSAIDMDSYRVEKQTMQRILLPDQDAEIEPVPTPQGSPRPDPELEQLSAIIRRFNDLFGNIPWEDGDRLFKRITETIPAKVAEDKAFRNAQKYSDKQNARLEFDKALLRVMTAMMKDETQLFKEYMDNLAFRRELSDTVFCLIYSDTTGS